jgi:hypothetical protein
MVLILTSESDYCALACLNDMSTPCSQPFVGGRAFCTWAYVIEFVRPSDVSALLTDVLCGDIPTLQRFERKRVAKRERNPRSIATHSQPCHIDRRRSAALSRPDECPGGRTLAARDLSPHFCHFGEISFGLELAQLSPTRYHPSEAQGG